MEVGHQVFPIANISRVQSLYFDKQGRFTAVHGILIAILIIVFVAGLATSASARSSADSGQLIAGIAILALLGVLLHGATATTNYYMLVIETSGAQSATLVSEKEDGIQWLKHEIVSAIENPPSTQQVLHLGDNIQLNGAQGVQIGSQNSQDNRFSGR